MAHTSHPTNLDERYIFASGLKKVLGILLAVGVLLLAGGIVLGVLGVGEHHETQQHDTEAANPLYNLKEASESPGDKLGGKGASDQGSGVLEHGAAHGDEAHPRGSGSPSADAAAEEHGPNWVSRLYAALWINNVYFTGLAVIGLFWVALQYASQAGWSTGFLRVPLAMASWLPYAGGLMLIVWLIANHDLFHWTHEYLFDEADPRFDPIIAGKKGYLNTFFYLGRMVVFFAIWIIFFVLIRKRTMEEDLHGGTSYWYTIRKYSAIFLVLFAVSSSMAAWDWVMSIDPHWFSTLFGWYVFASWWVSGIAAITLIVVLLREYGYLRIVTENHLHDLGKFIFAFSIFWTYLWFSQFLLIYYANIPEESIYYIERLSSDFYSPVFFINLILNFFFPFLVLMTRDAKRHTIFLKIVCAVVLFGHWLDFYLMITPAVMKDSVARGFGFMEIGLILIYASAFGFVVMGSLAKIGLIQKNHPMLAESMHHHI
jgi:Ni/Fe-hydrogenase subunit HybB-like protein